MNDGRLVVLSGGMDSTTLAYLYRQEIGETGRLLCVSFNYGQRHAVELGFAQRTADRLGADWKLVDLDALTPHLHGSALTDASVPVPEGHYAEDTMRATVVPNRNAILLSVATGIAVAENISVVGTAVHAGDHPIYPDCRPSFIDALCKAMILGTESFAPEGFRVEAPFLGMSKTDIAQLGDTLGVVWSETWSCYQGRALHCGRCGTCVERREAFDLARVEDPTVYERAA